MVVHEVNWPVGAPPAERFKGLCQIRYNHAGADCGISVLGEGRVAVVFDEPQFAVAPGQIAAFYAGDELVGGGWIVRGDVN